MPGVFLHCAVLFPDVDALPKDTAVNTWNFACDAVSPAAAAAECAAQLIEFYNVGPGIYNAVGQYIGSNYSRVANVPTIRVYDVTADLTGTPAGSPIAIVPWTLHAADAATTLPAECAVVMTSHSDYGTDPEFGGGSRPRARDRGRVYLPMNDGSTAVNDGSGHLLVANSPRQSIKGAAERLMAAAIAVGNNWCVWSRTSGSFKAVTGGWVDNAFDTVRGRGPKPTVRLPWGA